MDPLFEEFLQATKWVTCFNIFGTVCTWDTCFVSHQILFDNLKLWSESLFFSSAHLFSVLCFIHSLSLPYLHFHNLLYILVWCFQNCNQRCILQCYIYCRPFFPFTVLRFFWNKNPDSQQNFNFPNWKSKNQTYSFLFKMMVLLFIITDSVFPIHELQTQIKYYDFIKKIFR